MNKIYLQFLLCAVCISQLNAQKQFIARQGQASFFSYTSVENIEAKNNQVLSILDIEKKEIAVSMLMRAFTFKKDLMYEHFNESYIESDVYPKAVFQGKLLDYDALSTDSQTKIIRGSITIHGISKEVDLKTTISKIKNGYLIIGEFNLVVKDFNIKIPPILSKNIAKIVSIKIKFQYSPYEEVND
jgi:hypothetical protein